MTSNEINLNNLSLMNDIIFHEDDLTEEAKNQFDYHTEILRAFELDRRSIFNNDQITPVGRHIAFSRLDKLHTNCKKVLNYMAINQKNINANLSNIDPLVICGLPRTGTTLLYNL